jgi:hypothetical protein
MRDVHKRPPVANADLKPGADLEMRRRLRQLFDEDPEAFTRAIEDLQRAGKHWPKQLPPIPRKQITRQTQAMLLADYENRSCHGRQVKKDEWLRERAKTGLRYGHAYGEYRWNTADAIWQQVKEAKRLARSDPTFASLVAAYREDFISAGIGTI